MLRKNNNGQIVLIFVFMVMSMFTLTLLIVNTAKLTREKIKLQLAADSSSLAMATFQARSLNSVSDRNFLLKYPSGDKNRTYNPNPAISKYSFPGIDQADSSMYTFSSRDIYEEYIGMITPLQDQQNKFIELYENLIPMVSDEYILKNSKDAYVIEKYDTPLNLKREEIRIQYTDWEADGSGNTLSKRKSVNAWMDLPYRKPIFSYIKIGKKINVWNNEFEFSTQSAATVPLATGLFWPDPLPTYNSKIIQTGDEGTLH